MRSFLTKNLASSYFKKMGLMMKNFKFAKNSFFRESGGHEKPIYTMHTMCIHVVINAAELEVSDI